MEHVAIDLGGRKSQLCVRSSDGTILDERQWPTATLGSYLQQRPFSRVIVETCAESFQIADRARELGHEVRVVPATLVRSLGVGERRTKTDKRDAQKLSEVSTRIDLPSVHIPSQRSRQLKTVLGMREVLIGSRTKLINNVRGYFRTQGIVMPIGRKAAWKLFDTLADKEPTSELERALRRQLLLIRTLTIEIEEATKEVEGMAESDPIASRLMTIPGVGPVTALWFVAVIDSVDRFKSAHFLEAYLGLTPGEHSSSEHQQRLGITKAGSTALRRCLVQASWTVLRVRGTHPMREWMLEVAKRRGKRVAVVALARKLAGIMYALWRDNSVYEPKHAAR